MKMKYLILAALLIASPCLAANVTPIEGQSGDVAAASAVATLTGTALKRTYLDKVIISSNGATAGTCVAVAVTGADVGTVNWDYCAPAGATVPAPVQIISFPEQDIVASSGGNIVVTVPSLGTGNLHAAVTALGHTQ
jgi:hypothetical protein